MVAFWMGALTPLSLFSPVIFWPSEQTIHKEMMEETGAFFAKDHMSSKSEVFALG